MPPSEPNAARRHYEPPFDDHTGEFFCEVCGNTGNVFIQHPENEHVLVCAEDGTRYDTPEEGPWPLSE